MHPHCLFFIHITNLWVLIIPMYIDTHMLIHADIKYVHVRFSIRNFEIISILSIQEQQK